MARNPIPGGDRGKWGTVLNERLNELSSVGVAAQETADEAVSSAGAASSAASVADGKAVAAQGTADAAVAAVEAVAPEGAVRAVGKGELVVNVKDFGAVGDGVTDDTAAFEAAFDAVRGTKRRVYVPASAGKYLIAGTVDVSGVVVEGDTAGYFNGSGAVILGSGSNIVFDQQATTLASITMGIHGLRFENVGTAIKLSYSVYSRISDVSVIDSSGDSIVIGNNAILGPLWNVLERVKATSLGGSGLVLAGMNWCNANKVDTCYFKGTTGAVRFVQAGGFGAIANIFENTEFAGPSAGLVLNCPNQGTVADNCYFEPQGPAVVIDGQTSDLQLRANVYGSSGNDVVGYGDRFIDHKSGSARVRVSGGWVTTNAVTRQENMDFVGSDVPASLFLEMTSEPVLATSSTGFRLFDTATISTVERVNRGNMAVTKHSAPTIALRYPDGTRVFDIRRNGTQGGTDFGVYFREQGTNAMVISPGGQVSFLSKLGSDNTATATTLGTVARRLPIYASNGTLLGYIPIYDNIT